MDPQARVFEGSKTYDRVGCVIHKAIAEVDAGDILMERSLNNSFYSESLLTTALHEMASDMWVQFLEDKLK